MRRASTRSDVQRAAHRIARLFFKMGITPSYDPLALTTDPARVWRDWHRCLTAVPELAHKSWPAMVGIVIDAHGPRLAADGCSAHYLYTRGLAPNQCVARVGYDATLIAIVNRLWTTKRRYSRRQHASTPFAKLMEKGKMNPKSVRYISPQIGRCRDCAESRRLTVGMLRAWLLGAHSHRTNAPEPTIRYRINAMTFEDIYRLIADQPSKCLYNIVAECIASVTLNDPAMHLCAAATNPDFKVYASTVCKNAAIIADDTLMRLRTVDKIPRRRLKLAPVTFRADVPTVIPRAVAVQIVPASAAVANAQARAASRATGIAALKTYVCHACTLVHVPIINASRASKVKLGVSVNLSTLEMLCNNCGSGKAALRELTGHFITGTVRGQVATATCCTVCGLSVVNPVYNGELPRCRTCTVPPVVHVCLCGADAFAGAKPFLAGLGRRCAMYAPCRLHQAAVAELVHNPVPSVKDGLRFLELHAAMCNT